MGHYKEAKPHFQLLARYYQIWPWKKSILQTSSPLLGLRVFRTPKTSQEVTGVLRDQRSNHPTIFKAAITQVDGKDILQHQLDYVRKKPYGNVHLMFGPRLRPRNNYSRNQTLSSLKKLILGNPILYPKDCTFMFTLPAVASYVNLSPCKLSKFLTNPIRYKAPKHLPDAKGGQLPLPQPVIFV